MPCPYLKHQIVTVEITQVRSARAIAALPFALELQHCRTSNSQTRRGPLARAATLA